MGYLRGTGPHAVPEEHFKRCERTRRIEDRDFFDFEMDITVARIIDPICASRDNRHRIQFDASVIKTSECL